MNNPIEMSGEMTMTSREIAELTGKDHKHVMRDLRVLSDQLGGMFEGVAQPWTHPQNGQEYFEYVIKRDTCLTLLTGYDAVSRMRVVKRWQELEAAQKPQVPQTYAAALLEAGRLALELERSQQQLAIAAPKAEFVDRYVDSSGTYTFRQVAKMLGIKESAFRELLLGGDDPVMYRLAGRLTPYANHVEAGRFIQRTGVADNDHSYTESRFTTKGVGWIAGELAKAEAKKKLGVIGG